MDKRFDSEIVQVVVKKIMEDVISDNNYQHNKVEGWTSEICESILKTLMDKEWSYKYIVTSAIVQKNGAGFHSSTSCYWEPTTDSSIMIKWENKSLHCTVQVFALAL
ncbi:dynein light chain Tctex-type-like [Brevipalpus obovatus]|uniref:dynein light chain Tctex-type-like n=1 Tax=Brevipalpus obovatus TaxID=246614 RepID=UPI003D9DE2FD